MGAVAWSSMAEDVLSTMSLSQSVCYKLTEKWIYRCVFYKVFEIPSPEMKLGLCSPRELQKASGSISGTNSLVAAVEEKAGIATWEAVRSLQYLPLV